MKRIVSITEELVRELREARQEEVQSAEYIPAGTGGGADGCEFVPTCLIVEDDVSDAELSQRALEAMGARVRVAKTGDEALQLLSESKDPTRPDFDIIFLDLNLVGSTATATGYHVLKFVRQQFPRLHVVLVSGYIDQGILNFLSRDPGGYIGMIQKPLQKMDVQEIFQKHRLCPTATRQA
jgi:CheY-like chemotaxis protein